ncbi:uncharacterized protein LOC127132018 [Lathyrus oleraceus]|uniref:uncharacterized protein LOC127132018 n=1 Tax=Pisum sativum TaxID=3888 RepID=UPI0021D23C3C|nr:uncharacterized protein LOC127132018 [Pisum sativum]
MSQITMEELRRNQEAMKVEINQLKTQMSLIMEILQSMLRKEGNPVPTVEPEVVTPISVPDPLPPQEQPRGFHPHPVSPRAPYQRPFIVPRPRQRNPEPNQYPNQLRQPTRQRPRKPVRHIDQLPVSYSQVLPYLIKDGLIVPKELLQVIPPYPPGFDVNARCDFHAGAQGHSVENCRALKHKVQDLIDSRAIMFTPQGLNIVNTLMPSQEGPSATS